MSTIINCPSCSHEVRVPEEVPGQDVKCPECGNTLAAPTAPAPYLPEPSRSFEADDPPETANDQEYEDEEEERPWDRRISSGIRRDCEPHRGGLVLSLGIVSIVMSMMCGVIGLPCGLTAWIMGHRDLKKMRARSMDPQGMGTTQGGWICGIIGTIMNILWILGILAEIGFIMMIFRMAPPPGSGPGLAPPPRPVEIETEPATTAPTRAAPARQSKTQRSSASSRAPSTQAQEEP